MSTVLVVDDHAIVREPIEASLRRAGYETLSASNGAEAIALIQQTRPDLILLDIAMPVMDGMTMLRALRAAPDTRQIPVIILTAQTDKNPVIEAVKLGISGYLLKSRFSLKELLDQVDKQLRAPKPAIALAASQPAPRVPAVAPTSVAKIAPAAVAIPIRAAAVVMDPPDSNDPLAALKALKPIITRSQVIERIDNCGELKGFSPSVTHVLSLTNSAHTAIEPIARAISQDHAIALKVLKLANSAVYTRGDPVHSVQTAVLRIGVGQIRQAVLNLSVVERFSSAGLIDAAQAWEHAIACGIIAAEISHSRGEKNADRAFTMGLLHDVGRMLLIEQFPDEYATLLLTAEQLQMPLDMVESRLLLMDHADIMDRVLRSWKFPRELINPIVFHHQSAANIRRQAPQEAAQVGTLALANCLAHALMLGTSGNETVSPTEELCELIELGPDVMKRIEHTARDETDKIKFALLATSNLNNWPQRRDMHRSALAAPFRPLYVSSTPRYDAHRIFCEQLRDSADDPTPTVGVIHVQQARDRDTLIGQFLQAEANAGVRGLPVVLISPAALAIPGELAREGRRVEFILTPFVIPRFIKAINRLCPAIKAIAA